MEHEQESEVLHLLRDTYETTRKRALQSQTMFVERLGGLRRELDALMDALRLDFQEDGARDHLYYDALEKVRSMTAAETPVSHKENDAPRADLEDELFRIREALAASEFRVRELQEQLQAGVSQNLNTYIDNLKSHLEKKNEIIDTARKRILRLQQKIEGMAYERMEALQNAADLNMRISSRDEALEAAESRLDELMRKHAIKMSCMAAVTAQLAAMERHSGALKQQLELLEREREQNPRVEPEKDAAEGAPEKASDELMAQFSKQREELEDANTLLELMQEDLNNYQEKLQREEEKARILSEAVKNAEADLQECEARLLESKEVIASLEQEMDTLRKTLGQREEDTRLARELRKQAEEKYGALEKDLQEAEAKIQSYQLKLTEKETETESIREDNTLLKAEFEQARTAMKDWEGKWVAVQNTQQEVAREIDTARREQQRATEQYGKQKEEADVLKRQLEQVRQAFEAATQKSMDTGKALDEERRKVVEATQRAEALRLQAETSDKALLEAQEKCLEMQRLIDQQALESAQREKQATASAVNNLAEARNSSETLSRQVEELRRECEQATTLKKEAEKKIEHLQSEVKHKHEETETLSSRLEIAEEERQEAGIALKEACAEIEKLRGTVYEALSEKDTLTIQVKDMKEKMQAVEKTTKKTPSSKTLAALQEELEAERRRADMTQQLLDESLSGGTKGKLAKQLADARHECETLREELRQMQQQLKDKNKTG